VSKIKSYYDNRRLNDGMISVVSMGFHLSFISFFILLSIFFDLSSFIVSVT